MSFATLPIWSLLLKS
ncbi:hypothetical protein [Frankia sp. CpI1-P]|nr:hypothetical protein [Frankia sp. CpI1-P]